MEDSFSAILTSLLREWQHKIAEMLSLLAFEIDTASLALSLAHVFPTVSLLLKCQ